MAKLEWGKKHICSDCNTKFYDMSKSTPECPKCGSQVLITRKPRVGRPPLSQKKPVPTVTKTKDNNKDICLMRVKTIGENRGEGKTVIIDSIEKKSIIKAMESL